MKENNFENSKNNEDIQHSQISEKLVEMYKKDQELRHEIDFTKEDQLLASKMKEVDRENRQRLKEIVDEIGWPTISKVGKKGAEAAWLLAQHADQGLEFQKKCLELMKENKNDVSKRDVAYLEDRVLVNEGKPQKYGTQFYLDENKKLKPRPIQNKDKLNEKREEMGMKPFEESQMYKRMEEGYHNSD